MPPSSFAGERRPQRWQFYRAAAARGLAQDDAAAGPSPAPPALGRTGAGSRLRSALEALAAAPSRPARFLGRRRRTDVRLAPAALLVWASCLVCARLEPAAIAAVCAGMAVTGALLLMPRPAPRSRGQRSTASSQGGGTGSATRSVRATVAAGLLLSVAAGAHAAVASTQRHDGAVAAAIAGGSVAAELEVTGPPRRLSGPGRPGESERWAVPAALLELVFGGRRVEANTRIVVLGGPGWGEARAGQRLRTAGRLKQAAAGGAEAAVLAATSLPAGLARLGSGAGAGSGGDGAGGGGAGGGGGDEVLAGLRSGFGAAAAGLAGDARGLLPGMVTGDTAGLDPTLAAAMKTVGMTHLTAVSGANCSLVLGALLLAARTLRLPRPVAGALAFAGLGLFVLMVGAEASVLRAACMGTVGLAGLTAGRAGRGLNLLCAATSGLLLAEPALAVDLGFLLSVLATLGIVVAGGPIMRWLPAALPRALAAGFAVPLSAQLFCGPAVVLLQPQFSSYALPANLACAVLVPPVTLLGTAAVPLIPWAPAVAAVPVAVAGTFASGVAGIARYFAALPAAALPWPEGAFGSATMALLSLLTLSALWLAARPAAAWQRVRTMHDLAALFLARVLDRNTQDSGAARDRRGRSRRGLVDRSRRGRLRVCKPTFRRNHEWLLPQPNAPGPRQRTPPPGVT